MGLTVEVDKDRCISSGKCVGDEPRGFRFDEDELAEATPRASELDDARLLRVARNCPGEAIRLFDADGNPVELS
jgi:ferredoxin